MPKLWGESKPIMGKGHKRERLKDMQAINVQLEGESLDVWSKENNTRKRPSNLSKTNIVVK